MNDRTAGLPAPLARVGHPLLVPFGHTLLWPLLNHCLRRPIAEGELDFLAGRVLAVAFADLGVEWPLTFRPHPGRLERATEAVEARIRADSPALLQLAGNRVDPDTLFFDRRLTVEGDTELALQAKNLLDTLEPGDLPAPLRRLLDQAGRVAERWAPAS